MNRTCNYPGQPCPPAVQAVSVEDQRLAYALWDCFEVVGYVLLSAGILVVIVLSLLYIVDTLI
jgi:hypothetical protein